MIMSSFGTKHFRCASARIYLLTDLFLVLLELQVSNRQTDFSGAQNICTTDDFYYYQQGLFKPARGLGLKITGLVCHLEH